VNCCHANQDKFWVKAADGVEWEVYYLNYDLEGEEDVARGRRALRSWVRVRAAGAPPPVARRKPRGRRVTRRPLARCSY
jgi:hypothetical protein